MPLLGEGLLIALIVTPILIGGIFGYIYKRNGISMPFIISLGNIICTLGTYFLLVIGEALEGLQPYIFTIPFGLVIVLGSIFGQIWYLRQPLKLLMTQAQTVAEGDLTREVDETDRKDEFGIVINSFANMYTSLQNVITSTSTVAGRLVSAAQELASSTEEVNASSEEITSITQQISRGAQQQTEKISAVVKHAEGLKKEFNQQLQGIEAAADLIETISGQVNMLALNASIEAARAGEYGRGFAVVADNIRRLAEESKQSLVQVNQFIKGLRQTMVLAIDRIMTSIQTTVSIAEETVAGTEEASAATEEQAATMQEMSASTQELAKLGIGLESIVKWFKVDVN